MSFYRSVPLILACVLSCAASQTSAQDAAQATVAEGMGQGIGEAASGDQSVFVTATGRETVSARASDYSVIIEGRAATAVEAAKQHDDRLATIQMLAQKFGVTAEVGTGVFSTEVNAEAEPNSTNPARATKARLVHSASVVAAARQDEGGVDLFVVRSDVQFKVANPAQLPGFIDALKGAGISGGASNEADLTNFIPAEMVADSVWDRLSQKAITLALHQAQVLAKAAGREVGDAEQIMVLSKTVQGSQASLTISVRYLLK